MSEEELTIDRILKNQEDMIQVLHALVKQADARYSTLEARYFDVYKKALDAARSVEAMEKLVKKMPQLTCKCPVCRAATRAQGKAVMG